MIDSIRRALVIAAHPDDETLGAGGTIARLTGQGIPVDVAIVTDGSSAQHGDDMAARERRNEQMRAALDILGVETLFHGSFPDMRLDTVPHIDLNIWLSRTIRDSGCDTVFTHHHGDVNMDHVCINASTLVAVRPVPGQPVKRVFTYYVNSSTEWGAVHPRSQFAPNVFVDVSATIETKVAALNAYADEIRDAPHPRNEDAVRARARVTGSEVGVDYAEAFALLRCVEA
jgi:LmbE family N-acetylglucosaminyl deacetylase